MSGKRGERVCSQCGGGAGEKLFWCSGCHDALYCSLGCQKIAWSRHKQFCIQYQKLAEDARIQGVSRGAPVCTPDRVYLVGDAKLRNGVWQFAEQLESTFYPHCDCRSTVHGNSATTSYADLQHKGPGCGAEQHDKLDMGFVCWQEMPYVIISIPRQDFPFLEQTAEATGMRVCKGLPQLHTPKFIHAFPLFSNDDNLFHLENGTTPFTTDSKEKQMENFRLLMKGEKPKGPGPVIIDLGAFTKKK